MHRLDEAIVVWQKLRKDVPGGCGERKLTPQTSLAVFFPRGKAQHPSIEQSKLMWGSVSLPMVGPPSRSLPAQTSLWFYDPVKLEWALLILDDPTASSSWEKWQKSDKLCVSAFPKSVSSYLGCWRVIEGKQPRCPQMVWQIFRSLGTLKSWRMCFGKRRFGHILSVSRVRAEGVKSNLAMMCILKWLKDPVTCPCLAREIQ